MVKERQNTFRFQVIEKLKPQKTLETSELTQAYHQQ